MLSTLVLLSSFPAYRQAGLRRTLVLYKFYSPFYEKLISEQELKRSVATIA